MMSSMEFDCKLAHSDSVKKISGFNSIKELYERISLLFSIPIDQILFCTLNTHNFKDMDSLLGNYLSSGDLIVVHICGKKKDVNIKKTQDYLGLTITDNGRGRAFIKKISLSGDLCATEINPGDHIAAINADSTVGLRHYEVAKAIREVPKDTYFTMNLIEPLYKDNYIHTILSTSNHNQHSLMSFSRNQLSQGSTDSKNRTPSRESNSTSFTSKPEVVNLDSLYDDLANSSLPIDQLLSKSSFEPQVRQDSLKQNTRNSDTKGSHELYRGVIDKINSILECFLGINDNALAIQIYRLAKDNKDSYQGFAEAIKNSELSIFKFSDDIETLLWKCVYHQDR